MKKQMTVLVLATLILPAFAACAFADDFHAARKESREANHQRYKAQRDAFLGDRSGARIHARAADREEYRAWKHVNHL